MKNSPTSNYELLHPEVQRWVWRQGWEGLRPIQENSVPAVIGADRDVIIGAPTAGGKTEAAYLPIISNLLEDPVADGYAVLNLSPLKALINDQEQRLEAIAGTLGIEVTPWHGDIAMSRKKSSLTKPSGILLITPESLESMFANRPHALEAAFRNLRYVVIDELHAFMGSERGIQLMSLLSRLEHAIGRKVPRIALSATFSDYGQACDFLRPGRNDYPVAVPDAGNSGHDTLVLIKEFTSDGEQQFDDATAADLFRNLRGSNNLVFANSRKEAEALALRLKDMSEKENVPNEFRLHHGSLAKNERRDVERSLKEGTFPCSAICTSTLELGIDIGKVESIAQLVTANSVSGLRQRLGRSGRRGHPSVLRIYSLDEQRDDYKFHLRTGLVQNIAVVELMSQGRYEPIRPGIPHYSTLLQQVLSLTAQYGGFYAEDAWRLLCRDGAFRNIPPEDFLTLLKAMGQKGLIAQTGSGQIVMGREGEKVVKSPDFYTSFKTLQDLAVKDLNTGRLVGAVQYKPYVGEYILLAAQRWLVERVDDRTGEVGVKAAHTTGKMMFEGYGAEIDGIITRKMREIYESDTVYPYLDANSGAPEALAAARRSYSEMGLADSQTVSAGGEELLFTWGGVKLNRTLALMRKSEGFALPPFDPFAVAGVPQRYLERLRSGDVDLEELAELMPRNRKLIDKHDHYLPDSLLDKKYAAAMLATG